MKSYFRILLMGSIISLTGFSALSQSTPYQTLVQSAKLQINGSSNINEFSCEYLLESPLDTLTVTRTFDQKTISFEGMQFRFPVKKFDCGLVAMNKDFYEILNAEQSPFILLDIQSIQLLDEQIEGFEYLNVSTKVIITLSDVAQSATVQGTIQNLSETELIFKGAQTLHMTQFGITPPTKFFEMIKVNDALNTSFTIYIETIRP